MKILIIMAGFFPGRKYGGPPVSIDNFCSLLGSEYECYIVTHDHDLGDTIPYESIHAGWNDRGNSKVMYLDDTRYNYSSFYNIASDLMPDFIYLQGLFQSCIFPSLRIAKKLNIPVLLAPRGELCAGIFSKRYKKIPYIWFLKLSGLLKNVAFQSTSEEETDAIKDILGAKEKNIHFLTNIPSVPKSIPSRQTKEKGVGRFVFLSRITKKKNLIGAIELFRNIKGNVIFDIYGPKEDINYWNKCEDLIKTIPNNIKISYKGIVSHDDIHNTFGNYDSFVFPTYSENYGHVIAEAVLSQCIPIISDQTPWTDVLDMNAGWAYPLSDKNNFEMAIQEIVNMDNEGIKKTRENLQCYVNNKLKLSELKKAYSLAFSN